MKRLLPYSPLLLLLCLLLFPSSALVGAKEGLSLWWEKLFPSLLPCLICLKLMNGMGIWGNAQTTSRGSIVCLCLFSLLFGAPNGAMQIQLMEENCQISRSQAKALLPLVNQVSPLFLVTIIASGFLKNKSLLLPLAIGFYGPTVGLLAWHCMRLSPPSQPKNAQEPLPFPQAFSSAVVNSMQDMLKIGGCIMFSTTLLSLLRPLTGEGAAHVLLSALLEVSAGSQAIASLPIGMRELVSLLTTAASFGGLTLALQGMCVCDSIELAPYLGIKALLGLLSGLLCYLVFPLLPTTTSAFANGQEVLRRSSSLSGLLVCSAFSLLYVTVFTLMAAGGRNRSRKSAKSV